MRGHSGSHTGSWRDLFSSGETAGEVLICLPPICFRKASQYRSQPDSSKAADLSCGIYRNKDAAKPVPV